MGELLRYFVTFGDRTFDVDLSHAIPTVDGEPMKVDIATIPGSSVHNLQVDGRSISLVAQPGGRPGRWQIVLAGETLQAEVVDERTRAIREMTGVPDDLADKAVNAPMPGMIVRVEVGVGERVQAGQGVVIMEAMKMENELRAPADGVIARILVKAGEAVEKGALLLELE